MAESIVFLIFKLLLLFILVLIIGTLIKILLETFQGKNKQKLFKTRNIIGSDINTLASQLSHIKGYHKIYKTDDYLVYINEYHIDLVLVCNYCGMITGKENDSCWFLNSDIEKQKIDNPIIKLKKIEEILIKKTGIDKIRTYILIGGNTRFNIKVSKTHILRKGTAYYTLSKRNEKKIYTHEEVNFIYEKIKM